MLYGKTDNPNLDSIILCRRVEDLLKMKKAEMPEIFRHYWI